MATRTWYGNAAKVAQVNTVTPTAVDEEDYTITINGKSVSYTSGTSCTVAEIVTGLVAAFQASTEPEFQEVTATDDTTLVTLTASTPGVPFTSSSSATNTATLTTSTVTASAGPNHWGTAANWSGSTVPVDGDSVIIASGPSILYDLDQSSINLVALTIYATFTNQIGNTDYNGDYREYRTTFLTLDECTVAHIGLGDGNGSGLIRLNVGGNGASTVNVYKMGSPLESGQPALHLQGSNASHVLNAYSGVIGLAAGAGEAAQFPTIRAGYETSQSSDVQILAGSGCTLGGTITQSGGVVDVTTAVTTWNQTGGEATIRGTATVGTLNLDGGTMLYRSSGTMTTANVGSDGTLDFSRDLRTRTVTNCVAASGSRVLDPFTTVTFTNGVKLNRSGVQSGTRSSGVVVDFGEHITITPSAY